MNLEQLKAEADILGYKLVKKQVYVRFKPCVCGTNYRNKYFSGDKIIFECKNCGLRAEGKTEVEARRAWNEMVEPYLNEPEPILCVKTD